MYYTKHFEISLLSHRDGTGYIDHVRNKSENVYTLYIEAAKYLMQDIFFTEITEINYSLY